jgi:ribosome maturation factor RimP
MDKQDLTPELQAIVADCLKRGGFELVDIIYRYEGRDLFLRILADRPEGGINLAECSRLNKEIGLALDEKDLFPGRYILEVSSPGIDRPLETKKDFLRCLNTMARVFLRQALENKMEILGLIQAVEDDRIVLDIGGESREIPLNNIVKAKQVLE